MNMQEIFILFFVIYFVLEFFQNISQTHKFSVLTRIIQTGVFLFAVGYLVAHHILPRNFFSVPGWIAGLLLGHVFYSLGFLITVGFDPIVKKQFLSLLDLIRFSWLSPVILGRTFTVALTEEIIYRAGIQSILIEKIQNVPMVILVVAIAFTLVHKHIFHNRVSQNIEFLFFSIIIGVLYHITQDLGFVTILHFVRNMESIYLEFQEKLQEINDVDKCLDEMEKELFSTVE